MPLTDTAVRNARSYGKNYSLKDMEGLSLCVGITGGKHCIFVSIGWAVRFESLWEATQKSASKPLEKLEIKRERWLRRALIRAQSGGRSALQPARPSKTPLPLFSSLGANLKL